MFASKHPINHLVSTKSSPVKGGNSALAFARLLLQLLVSALLLTPATNLVAGAPVVDNVKNTVTSNKNPSKANSVSRNTAPKSKNKRGELLELIRRLQLVENENLLLHGKIEELQHQIDKLNKQQKKIYSELDQRLQERLKPKATTPTPVVSQVQIAEKSDYTKALGSLRDGDHTNALEQFAAFIKKYPDGRYIANAWYWQSEVFYVQGKFKKAISGFKSVAKKFPASHKAADALYKVALSYLEIGDKKSAKKHLKTLIKKYPQSKAAKKATKKSKSF